MTPGLPFTETYCGTLHGKAAPRYSSIFVRGERGSATSIPGIDDKAAEEPADEVLPPFAIEDLVPTASSGNKMNTPPPMFAAVSGPAQVSPTNGIR